MGYRLTVIVSTLLLSVAAWAQEVVTDSTIVLTDSTIVLPDTIQPEPVDQRPKNKDQRQTIYQGTTLKLDIGSTAMVVGMSKGAIQHYEMAVNVRLAQRFYPTLEGGYAGGTTTQGDSLSYNGKGGFFRVGCDINPLKKHPESPHAMLIGVRLGTSFQEYAQDGVRSETDLTSSSDFRTTRTGGRADCWGEIVAGCQVEMAKVGTTAFYMGWQGRFRFLFTREKGQTIGEMGPIYIPGYGKRDTIGWGLSYHIGWRF